MDATIKNLKSRKILIYFTMVVTFIILISQLIGTLYGYFQGTSTTNAAMHLAVSMLIAGSVFVYLFLDVKGDRQHA